MRELCRIGCPARSHLMSVFGNPLSVFKTHPPSCWGRRLAQVRHETGQKWAKPFRISSGNGRVYTTFSIEVKAIGEADVELLKEGSLFGVGFGDTAETKLAAVGGGKDDVGALQGGQQGDGFHRRQWRGIIDTAGGFLRNHRWPAFQQMLERHP